MTTEKSAYDLRENPTPGVQIPWPYQSGACTGHAELKNLSLTHRAPEKSGPGYFMRFTGDAE